MVYGRYLNVCDPAIQHLMSFPHFEHDGFCEGDCENCVQEWLNKTWETKKIKEV